MRHQPGRGISLLTHPYNRGVEDNAPKESAKQAAEDALARIHREYRDECTRLGTYKGIDPKSVEKEIARWKAECSRPPRNTGRKSKHPPKGHAD